MSYKIREKDLIETDISEYLRRHEEKDMLRFLTAGSVDDGKSTLIGRLLYDSHMIYEDQLAAVLKDSKKQGNVGEDEEFDPALLTDGLKAEREQGITIDVAYRYFSTEKRSFIICDSPGHEQYTRNMATGASRCDLAIILVDARNGVLPQTKRHSFVATLLGIRHLVVAVNKMDAVDYDQDVFENIRKEYLGFAAKFDTVDIHFIPISALKGDNLVNASQNMPWFHGEPLLSYLEQVEIATDTNLIDFRFPVQYVIRPHLDFRGFAGTISSGIIRKGDEITVLPSNKKSKIKSIHTFDGELDEAFAPMAVVLTTEDEVDISRGDVISRVNNVPITSNQFEATLVWMDEKPLRAGNNYILKCGAASVPASIEAIRYQFDINELKRENSEEFEMNAIGRVSIVTHRPIPFDVYKNNRIGGSFILVDNFSNFTAAAGMILEQKLSSDEQDLSQPASSNIYIEQHGFDQASRIGALGYTPGTIWLTGLSGSGKSTIARELEKRLMAMDLKAFILDGNNVRHRLNRDLGFSPKDRKENARRTAEVARLMNEAGIVVICSLISPYQSDRDQARAIITEDSDATFTEVYLNTPLEVCSERDPHELYSKAGTGEICGFTGIDAPYEAPANAELELNTDKMSIEDCTNAILGKLPFLKK